MIIVKQASVMDAHCGRKSTSDAVLGANSSALQKLAANLNNLDIHQVSFNLFFK